MPVQVALEHMQCQSLQSMPDNFFVHLVTTNAARLTMALLPASASTQAAETMTRGMQGLMVVLHILMA